MNNSPATLVEHQPSAAPNDAPSPGIETNAATSTPAKGIKTMIKNSQEIVAFGEGNLEALATASKIWVVGMQDLTKQVTSSAKASFEESVATVKALVTAKSVKEAIDLQSTYTKNVVANAFTESSKLTEASLKLTEQALAPLTARMAAAVGVLSKAA
jgi:phasin family protein